MKLWRLGFALAFGIAVRCVSGCQKQEDNSCCTPVQRRLYSHLLRDSGCVE